MSFSEFLDWLDAPATSEGQQSDYGPAICNEANVAWNQEYQARLAAERNAPEHEGGWRMSAPDRAGWTSLTSTKNPCASARPSMMGRGGRQLEWLDGIRCPSRRPTQADPGPDDRERHAEYPTRIGVGKPTAQNPNARRVEHSDRSARASMSGSIQLSGRPQATGGGGPVQAVITSDGPPKVAAVWARTLTSPPRWLLVRKGRFPRRFEAVEGEKP